MLTARMAVLHAYVCQSYAYAHRQDGSPTCIRMPVLCICSPPGWQCYMHTYASPMHMLTARMAVLHAYVCQSYAYAHRQDGSATCIRMPVLCICSLPGWQSYMHTYASPMHMLTA